MPSYFPEGNTPLASDLPGRSLQKIVALLGGGGSPGGSFIPRTGADVAAEDLVYAAAMTIDFDGPAGQRVDATGNIQFSTSNRATTGETKLVSVRVNNTSGAPITLSFNANINVMDTVPVLGAAKVGWVSFASSGSAETATDVRVIVEN